MREMYFGCIYVHVFIIPLYDKITVFTVFHCFPQAVYSGRVYAHCLVFPQRMPTPYLSVTSKICKFAIARGCLRLRVPTYSYVW